MIIILGVSTERPPDPATHRVGLRGRVCVCVSSIAIIDLLVSFLSKGLQHTLSFGPRGGQSRQVTSVGAELQTAA